MSVRRTRTIAAARLHGPAWLGGSAQLFVFVGAAQADRPAVWPWALLLIAAISAFAWAANYRRYRQMRDLPTSRIASAAQGYVELFGRSEALPGSGTTSRFRQTPCCWHAWRVRRRDSRNRWVTIDHGRSEQPFRIVDDSGACIVLPAGAEVLSGSGQTWHEGDRELTEWLLLSGAMLYAIGAFDTARPDAIDADKERSEVATLLAEWKRDATQLRTRFGHDGNGEVDLREWEEARLAAQREVRERRGRANAGTASVHTLARPRDGRLFLLANALPERIAARFRYWSWAHLAFCIAALVVGLSLL
ncbi:MAG TPA: hypothetical protein PKZ77_05480 [Pseudomonadales bacterium]|nr:hypothetical protein [Pseudomonadales bacterium]HNC69919.1 hypothetical protein [Pseudomonadales bacterium]HND13912.1 hypothetical protein [Pseudomonadales bacterium]